MVAKLKLVLQSHHLPLAFRRVLFGGVLAMLPWSGFHWLALLVFIIVNGLLYIYPLTNSLVYSASFVVGLFTISWWLMEIQHHSFIVIVSIIGCAVIWHLLISLKNERISTDRLQWYAISRSAILYVLALSFFIHADTFFGIKLVGLAIGILALSREWLKMIYQRVTREDLYLAGAITILTVELAWILTWLPIGFFAAANLLFFLWYGTELLLTRPITQYKHNLMWLVVLISILTTLYVTYFG